MNVWIELLLQIGKLSRESVWEGGSVSTQLCSRSPNHGLKIKFHADIWSTEWLALSTDRSVSPGLFRMKLWPCITGRRKQQGRIKRGRTPPTGGRAHVLCAEGPSASSSFSSSKVLRWQLLWKSLRLLRASASQRRQYWAIWTHYHFQYKACFSVPQSLGYMLCSWRTSDQNECLICPRTDLVRLQVMERLTSHSPLPLHVISNDAAGT